jgi:hypothetical protein
MLCKGGSATQRTRWGTCTAVLTAACKGEGSPGLSGLMAVPRSCRESPAATPNNVMLCYVMLCYVMLCYVMLCCIPKP